MEYSISKVEVERRKKTFRVFGAALFVGFIVTSLLFFRGNWLVPAVISTVFATILFTSDFYLNKFFTRFLKTKFALDDKKLKRISDTAVEEFRLNEIKKVVIKRTVHKNIRSLSLHLKANRVIFINGLDRFEGFATSLIEKLDEGIVVVGVYEHLDYDSLIFYSALGLLLSSLAVRGIQVLTNSSADVIRIYFYASAAYILALSLYFFFYTPLRKWYGSKEKTSDYILGFVGLLLALLIFFVSL